jgi:REP element-mobilizing transposase RayT
MIMPKRKVPFAPGNYYHIYNRGINKARIFFNGDNYKYCLRQVQRHREKYGAAIIAYCLMPNHYHFLLRQEGEQKLSRFISALFNGYVQAVNRQQDRSGPLFEGRFKNKHIDKESYLIHLCRYIHANPVRAGLVSAPEAWPYSNYREWIGLRSGTLIDHDFVDTFFPNREGYQTFVYDYAQGKDILPHGIDAYLF